MNIFLIKFFLKIMFWIILWIDFFFTFFFDSVFNIQNRTRQCFCMNYIDHAWRHQIQHVLYFLNAGGSMISNMSFSPPCVMKVISLHFSAFYILWFWTIWRSVPSYYGRHFLDSTFSRMNLSTGLRKSMSWELDLNVIWD